MSRIRTLNFLPEIFQTPTNAQFLGATLDQLVNPPVTKKIEGYIGSKFGYGINARDYYVTEPNKVRTDYQLDPGVVFTKANETTANDFISYPGILDSINTQGGIVNNNDRLFESQFYSWDSFTNLDKLINYNEYYWLPEGPPAVTVAAATVFSQNEFIVTDLPNSYNIRVSGQTAGSDNPTITLLRGGTYNFIVDQDSGFYIQTLPGADGVSPANPNQTTRLAEQNGVVNNGATSGVVNFTVPQKDAQNNLLFPNSTTVDLVTSQLFANINGMPVSQLGNIDGITSLNGLTLMFYNTSEPLEEGYTQQFYSENGYDTNNDSIVAPITIEITDTDSLDNSLTCESTANLTIGSSVTFSGNTIGGIELYNTAAPVVVNAGSFSVGEQYIITTVGTTDWITAGLSASATVTAEIIGTKLIVASPTPNQLSVGQTISGSGVTAGTIITGYDLTESLLLGQDVYTVSVSQTVISGTTIYGYDIYPGTIFTAAGAGSGTGVATPYVPNIYYIESIINSTQFTISQTLGGSVYNVTTDSGTMIANVNQGLYQEGVFNKVRDYFYKIVYVGSATEPVIRLEPFIPVPLNTKITAKFGNLSAGLSFYKANTGIIQRIPLITAPLDTLYYQDGTTNSKVGIIKIIENNAFDTLNVVEDILGKKNFTSKNGVVFTNGLKVEFDGDVIPSSYLEGQYYVEGVGTAIKLIPVGDLICPEPFTVSTTVGYDILNYDIGNYDSSLFIPIQQDYITISRDSINLNPWSRSNRWFHKQVINSTATYNNDPTIATRFATQQNKAKRPIIEFYPNIKMFRSGSGSKPPVDFMDFRTTDALSTVAGQPQYYPDVKVYTAYTANIATNPTVSAGSLIVGQQYEIVSIGTTDWELFGAPAGYTVGTQFTATGTGIVKANQIVASNSYTIVTVGTTSWTSIGSPTNTVGQTFTATGVGSGSGTAVQGNGTVKCLTTTTVTINNADIFTGTQNETAQGSFQLNQYINDLPNYLTPDVGQVLPSLTRIIEINEATVGDDVIITLTVAWADPTDITPSNNASLIANDIDNNNYILFPNARIVFGADENLNVRNKIFIASYSVVDDTKLPVITLTVAPDGEVFENDQIVSLRGYEEQGLSHYFDGVDWVESQQKTNVNQAPLFDIFDNNGISLSNEEIYQGSNFRGTKLFSYGIGSGNNDSVLGFPLKYSEVNNLGDISFEVNLNKDTFSYVSEGVSVEENINVGYVYNYLTRETYERQIGWQTANGPSIQYQIFELNYEVGDLPIFTCDVPVIEQDKYPWPVIQVYKNNVLLAQTDYTVSVVGNNTIVSISNLDTTVNTPIQILLVSEQVSPTAYYEVPINLSNNPFNTDITSANLGDIRGQYQSIFYNNPNSVGQVFGSNNTRDLGNLVPYGNRIIQNSASLVLPGAFLRKKEHNLINALTYNSREYIKFKTLLMDVVQNTDYTQRFDPSYMLDDALDQITANKTEDQPFFWSDMLPSKAAFVTNTYTFNNNLDTSIYPLNQVYNFDTANYNGILVYLQTTVDNVNITVQLVKDVDYTVSSTAPSLTVTRNLASGDKIVIKQYNQTYGSYVPNTPTKLGMYPATIPRVVLDPNYVTPTYFIVGHDGSYTKLYGEYNSEGDYLIDYRDQVLLEFEKRIYNNLKLSNVIPLSLDEVGPGFFRNTDYSYDEYLQIYSPFFLDWAGQNRINYKLQLFNAGNEFSFNYKNTTNKVNNELIQQGYWRGVYQYFYDTTNPNNMPWEMLGFTNKPDWWEARYGAAPYTSNNFILWDDLSKGYVWNNGDAYILPTKVRDGLLKIIPVNDTGALLSPLSNVVNLYSSINFKKEWQVGDDGPAEFAYRRSSSYPFDVMKILAVTKPAKFYNLCVDLDNYKYNEEFNQFLVNGRTHLVPNEIEIYGNGTAKTSYINWIVDYEKQLGINATQNIINLLDNIDVRLVYRLAGFSDKTLLKFYVEKGTPNTNNSSLLIPDESYAVLLYDNEPAQKLTYSSVIVQKSEQGFQVYGNSQTVAYFTILKPILNGQYTEIRVEDTKVKVAKNYTTIEEVVPYGTLFYSVEEVSQFLMSYGAALEADGQIFEDIEAGIEINWQQMVAEFLYWTQVGWEVGSIISLNPSAKQLVVDKESLVVQPLTIQQNNFILNQNLYPIQNVDLSIFRDGTKFSVKPLNSGDALSYAQFYMSNIEHGVVFDNITLFNDVIYNLVTGLRQNRIYLRGTKSADWNGTMFASGFIYNQDNIQEWRKEVTYTKGSIVKFKNKYWVATKVIQPGFEFKESDWKVSDYNEIQTGLLPNSSTRSYESALYYNVDEANLEKDADLLSFSLIGYRPRDYMALADLTDITQINVYKNMIKNKGTRNAVSAFKGANLPQGGIEYDLYENWAILSGSYGGTLNNNFVEFKINQNNVTGNPSIVSLTNGQGTEGSLQEIPLYSLYNYNNIQPTDPNILSTLPTFTPNVLFPDAGYANFNDVKMFAYFYSQLPIATDNKGVIVPIQNFYIRDFVWIADYLSTWQIYTPASLGIINVIRSNPNNTSTVVFEKEHGLSRFDIFAIVNFSPTVDGYYIVDQVVNQKSVIISLALANNTRELTGQGIGLKFNTQRVAKSSDITDLDLLSAEFTKNRVWVDEASDGGWGVYEKSLNYKYFNELTKSGSSNYGSAVAYTTKSGYLIGDSTLGDVYRFTYNDLYQSYDLAQTLTGTDTSYGETITYRDNIYVVSQPIDTPTVFVYVINDTFKTDDITEIQTITRPAGLTGEWGTATALSGDKNWLYISAKDDNKIYVYRKENISLNADQMIAGETYVITSVGTTDFTDYGATDNEIGNIFRATNTGTGTGTVNQISYKLSTILDGTGFADALGTNLATDWYGDTLISGDPLYDYDLTTANYGQTYVYQRMVQNIEVQSTTKPLLNTEFPLAFTVTTGPARTSTEVTAGNNIVANAAMTGLEDYPVVFTGSNFGDTGLQNNQVYYISTVSGTNFTVKESRTSSSDVVLTAESGLSLTIHVQKLYDGINATVLTPVNVTVNGLYVTDDNYAVVNNNLVWYTSQAGGGLNAGDIVNVSSGTFTKIQTLTTEQTPRIGVQFGRSVDTTYTGSEVLVGAPNNSTATNQQGAIYRFTNGGGKYGIVVGTADVNVTTTRNLLINGYNVRIPVGNATVAATAINNNNITNIQAAASNNRLIISVINSDLTVPNEKLLISAPDADTLTELGIDVYTQTQIINCPHSDEPTQFGYTIKFNEFDSFVASAPVGSRYSQTTFDFTDDLNLDNDTIFDNNATQFIEQFRNAGAVYMFDYVANYNESLDNVGAFVYAQSCNATNLDYGYKPMYGTALDFNQNNVVVGTPGFRIDVDTGCGIDPGDQGQVVIYVNQTGIKDWSLYRQSNPIVDVSKIENTQLFSAETNNTLVNLDYIDPLQGKLLGAVRQNIDVISNVDPASYNNGVPEGRALVWGEDKEGYVWFDTSNVRFVNYHQNDNVYNSQYWGSVFPGSDVAVYSWIVSNQLPISYTGPGIVKDPSLYTVINKVDNTGNVADLYCFWVRNSSIIFKKRGKTLADTILESYIANPKNSGIAYMAPILPNAFALYNSQSYINANDTVFHIGYATGISEDVPHNEFTLIRENYADDFLPGLPRTSAQQFNGALHGNYGATRTRPEGLYDRLLDSLSGCDEAGQVVPNPFLPKAVQSGVLVRPRQSFFYDRYLGLKNYLTFANDVLKQYPIIETASNYTYLYQKNSVVTEDALVTAGNFVVGTRYRIEQPGTTDFTDIGSLTSTTGTIFIATGPGTGNGTAKVVVFDEGEKYDTTQYWQTINWWAEGYNDATKSVIQVPIYADLSALNVPINTIVTVESNSVGLRETYRYDGADVWTRIGLQNGTIQFNIYLWDYAAGLLGFSGNYFDSAPFDQYPSEETRWVVRALNEQIYVNELMIYRNQSLILLFNYIQSETLESQNYLPWLSKTSLVDVNHKVRDLLPIENYQSDNQDFLSGYINEVKPYHVVIKDFLFTYTGIDEYQGNVTDFDLPSQYNTTIEKFVSPQLVYSDPNNTTTYGVDNAIWTEQEYTQWFQNRGVTITGQNDYLMTTLDSWVTLGSNFLIVKNGQGFPINGVIRIGEELISYTSVDRTINALIGLVRGVNGTTIVDHLPGENIYMDLPPVLVLNGGRGYTNPPKVIAYQDPSYPAPIVEAQLEAVMSIDSVLSINVVDPGQGYSVLPEIIIDPAVTVTFKSSQVDVIGDTIQIYAPQLQTGDIVRYRVGADSTSLGGLQNNQWYYVALLETSPISIIALYETASDALKDQNRVDITSIGSGNNHTLNQGAKASAISTAFPIRMNDMTIRFDRTTYNSQVLDWETGAFYGAFFAGDYNNTQDVSSSSLTLQQSQPNINTIYASAQGFVLEIQDVENDREVEWSTFTRNVQAVLNNNVLRLQPAASDFTGIGSITGTTLNVASVSSGSLKVGDVIYGYEFDGSTTEILNGTTILSQTSGTPGGAGVYEVNLSQTTDSMTINTYLDNTSGTTVGFTLGMPVRFTSTSGAPAGIDVDTTYYIAEVINLVDFTISTNETLTPVVTISPTEIIAPGLQLETAKVTDTAILTVNYPGIRTATQTSAGTNYITVPLNDIGTGGTKGLYIDAPIIFVGNVFGGIRENENYFVTTVVDDQTFTISENPNPKQFNVYACSNSLNTVTVDSTVGLVENEPVIFNSMIIENVPTLSFGGIQSGVTYYIDEVVNATTLKLRTVVNGGTFNITSDVVENRFTSALMTSQTNTVSLTNATGNMTMNIALPVSPGQIDGQLFTLYNTSQQYTNVTGDISDTLSVTVNQALSASNKLAISSANGIDNFYINMPVEVTQNYSTLNTSSYYYVQDIGVLTATVTYISGTDLTVDSTDDLYVGMPVIFQGTSIAGVIIGTTYYIESIDTGTSKITISDTPGGSAVVWTVGGGLMTLVGEEYIKVSDITPAAVFDGYMVYDENTDITTLTVTTLTSGTISVDDIIRSNSVISGTVIVSQTSGTPGQEGDYIVTNVQDVDAITMETYTAKTLTDDTDQVTLSQIPDPTGLDAPVFSISYILGGYRTIITSSSVGFALNNVITIDGALLGGESITNDCTLIINSIDPLGSITNAIVNGTPAGLDSQYYLKVVGTNTMAVYSDPLFASPVSGIDFPYYGVVSTTSVLINNTTDKIVVASVNNFNVDDAVVFTGTNIDNQLTIGIPYYIVEVGTTIDPYIKVSTVPSGAPIDFTDVTPTTTVNMVISKLGANAFLPEPFYFNQSIVKYNNRVYQCIVSNNDDEFIFGKWQLLESSDRRLNAMDRTIGYYQPTDNMPGVDLSQLFEGVVYPNSTYLGNKFQPDPLYTVDTVLQDQPFYPTNVNLTSILYNGERYIAPANLPTYSALVEDEEGTIWGLSKLANSPLGLSDIVFAENLYVMTSTNSATPVFRSADGVRWSTNGYFTGYSDVAYDTLPYDSTSLSVSSLKLNSVAFKYVTTPTIVTAGNLIVGQTYVIRSIGTTDFTTVGASANTVGTRFVATGKTNGSGTVYQTLPTWVAVGANIVRSYDTYVWSQSYQFPDNTLENELFSVCAVELPNFDGFIAVGKGQYFTVVDGLTEKLPTNLLLFSEDGITWNTTPSATPNGMYGVTASDNLIVTVGENGIIYISDNGENWTGINELSILSINGSTDVLVVTNTLGLSFGDQVQVSQSFDVLTAGTDYYIAQIVSYGQIRLSDEANDTVATSIVPGESYVITDVGTTNWTLIGAASNTAGVVFTATGTGLGDGTARKLIDLTGGAVPTRTYLFTAPQTANLNDVQFVNNQFMAVGDTDVDTGSEGLIKTSTDGITWTTQSSGVYENLNGLTYSAVDDNKFTVVGDNNTIIQSEDNGVTWSEQNLFTVTDPAYTVKGDPFLSGYGPEELVPGIVTDSLIMTVTTRAGTNWDATQYQHVGYEVVSLEFEPSIDNTYSFLGQGQGIVNVPAEVIVSIIDTTTGLSTTIYVDENGTTRDYYVDWILDVIVLHTPLTSTQKLRVDVIGAGNGDQLVKSSTKIDPLRDDGGVGFKNIVLNCNYVGQIYQGGGAFKPSTPPEETVATSTSTISNFVRVADINKFSLNTGITFSGAVFGQYDVNPTALIIGQTYQIKTAGTTNWIACGAISNTEGTIFTATATGSGTGIATGGIIEDVVYYVKTISTVAQSITLSNSLTTGGVAGVTLTLPDDTGSMTVVINASTGELWSPPVAYWNGNRLTQGHYGIISQTNSTTNTITSNSTDVLDVGAPITFSTDMIGGVQGGIIEATDIIAGQTYRIAEVADTDFTTIGATSNSRGELFVATGAGTGTGTVTAVYYVQSIVDSNEFTISPDISLSSTITLTSEAGKAYYVTFDYAITLANNNVNASMVFSAPYDTNQDYIAYSIMGETQPEQYGYTIPETQVITSDGSTEYDLIYNVTGDNPQNAIVEVNGLRQILGTDYTIYSGNANIQFTTIPGIGDTIAVTSFNDTQRQYLNTQWNLSGNQVTKITNVDNVIAPPLAVTTATDTNSNGIITVASTDGFIVGQNVQFKPLVAQADTLAASLEYQIYVSGDTDWVSIGSADNNKGTIFTASGPAPTTPDMGSAILADFGGVETLGTVYLVKDFSASLMTTGNTYRIISAGTTDFTTLGAANNNVGTVFVYNGASVSGTGTVLGTTEFSVTYANGVTPSLSNFNSATVVAIVGGTETATVTTTLAHNLSENDYVTIDGTPGSVQLNNQSFYVHVLNDYTVALYTTPYDPAYSAVNSTVTTVSTYTNPPGGGYIWLAGSFIIQFTQATAATSIGNYLTVVDSSGLVEGTPVIFTQAGSSAGDTIMGGLEYGKTYYILAVDPAGSNTLEITDTIDGTDTLPLTTDSGNITVSQFEQVSVDRLYVTVNGYRVPSSSLRLNRYNVLSILVEINSGDDVIITSMMPTATPDENIYLLTVDSLGQGTVYRDNSLSRTWLTQNLYELQNTIYVNDASRLVKVIEQTYTGLEVVNVDNFYTLTIDADKNQITNISVYNVTKDRIISPVKYTLIVESLTPKIMIEPGSYIDDGDTIEITTVEGNTIVINGEQIRFGAVDLINNTLTDLQRGYNGSPVNMMIPVYSEVYGLLNENKMSDIDYNQTWNSDVYNTVLGDPLQISLTAPAQFLRTDN